ncbi:hypothetical protein ENSA7_81700 [Enhygromyxa salina]|uniref:Uncharacterized protein n=1 Tax=Enhygromyxa salina TaxID=215803 RepID=A0A2S9XH85_9BACT|nr:hypothetical protein ENSA7_81700 [Enhygromyxa salina]
MAGVQPRRAAAAVFAACENRHIRPQRARAPLRTRLREPEHHRAQLAARGPAVRRQAGLQARDHLRVGARRARLRAHARRGQLCRAGLLSVHAVPQRGAVRARPVRGADDPARRRRRRAHRHVPLGWGRQRELARASGLGDVDLAAGRPRRGLPVLRIHAGQLRAVRRGWALPGLRERAQRHAGARLPRQRRPGGAADVRGRLRRRRPRRRLRARRQCADPRPAPGRLQLLHRPQPAGGRRRSIRVLPRRWADLAIHGRGSDRRRPRRSPVLRGRSGSRGARARHRALDVCAQCPGRRV